MPETHDLAGDGWRINVLVESEDGPARAPSLTPTLGEYPIYDAPCYEVMATDTERNWRFQEALDRHARDRVVIDIGTGAFLFWARQSLRYGARRAVAVEAMEPSYLAASELLRNLEEQNRISLMYGESTRLTIEPKADLCVAEIIGSLAGAEGAAAVLHDAKRRHLTADAIIVPDECRTRAAAVSFPELFADRQPVFSRTALVPLQRIFDWNGGPFDVRLRLANPAVGGILSDSAVVERLEFNGDLKVEQLTEVQLVVDRSGCIDGVLTWLELQCLPGQVPLDALQSDCNWASIYLPLFDQAVPVDAGDVLELSVRVTLSEHDGVHPDYQVAGQLHTAHGVYCGTFVSPYRHDQIGGHPIYQTLFPTSSPTETGAI
ncbi:MAG: class I SAM-dependent methyltransferase [Planctomycetota bacterium]